MSDPRPLALIAAVARNGVIGAGNALPWRLPTDLRHFRATTWGKPVIMGRKTYESIGRPLPGRRLVVVSSQPGFRPDGVMVARSPEAALDRAQAEAVELEAAEVMVAGGGTLYAALIGRAARLYLTEVEAEPAGDTLFPPVQPERWRVVSRERPMPAPGDEAPFTFTILAAI